MVQVAGVIAQGLMRWSRCGEGISGVRAPFWCGARGDVVALFGRSRRDRERGRGKRRPYGVVFMGGWVVCLLSRSGEAHLFQG